MSSKLHLWRGPGSGAGEHAVGAVVVAVVDGAPADPVRMQHRPMSSARSHYCYQLCERSRSSSAKNNKIIK